MEMADRGGRSVLECEISGEGSADDGGDVCGDRDDGPCGDVGDSELHQALFAPPVRPRPSHMVPQPELDGTALDNASPGMLHHSSLSISIAGAAGAGAGLAHSAFHFLVAQVTDPYLNLFRNLIPPLMGQIDFTPIFGFLVLQFLAQILGADDIVPAY